MYIGAGSRKVLYLLGYLDLLYWDFLFHYLPYNVLLQLFHSVLQIFTMANRFFERAAHAAAYVKFRPQPPQSLIDGILSFLKSKVKQEYHFRELCCEIMKLTLFTLSTWMYVACETYLWFFIVLRCPSSTSHLVSVVAHVIYSYFLGLLWS